MANITTTNSWKYPSIRFWLLSLPILILSGCFETQSTDSPSDSVIPKTPGAVKFSFKEKGAPTTIAGKVEIFGSTHIPLPDANPGPIATFQLDGDSIFLLNPKIFYGIQDSVWPWGSITGDARHNFNVVFSDFQRASIVFGLSYSKNEQRIASTDPEIPKASALDETNLEANLTPLVEPQMSIKPYTAESNRSHLVFILGTNFHSYTWKAQGREEALFHFNRTPIGHFKVCFVAYSPKGTREGSSDRDSLFVYMPASGDLQSENRISPLSISGLTPTAIPKPKGPLN